MSAANAIDRVLALAAIPELAELHPDDLASLAERAEPWDAAGVDGDDTDDGDADGPVAFLLAGGVETRPSRRRIEAPALVGGVEALAGAPFELRPLGAATRLLRVGRDDLRWVIGDVFEVWLAMMRHAARRLLAAEPLDAEPLHERPAVDADAPGSLATRILLLGACEILSGLRVHALGRIASDMEECRFEAGAALWEPGDASAHAWLLLEGRVASAGGRSGAEARVHGPGVVLGLRELLADRARRTRLEAASEVRALRLSGEALVDELEDDPDTAAVLLESIARRALRAEGAAREEAG